MRSIPRLLASLALLLPVACASGGSGDEGRPDAGSVADAGPTPDAGPSPDGGGQSVSCDYTEAADADNDVVAGGTAEDTGLTFSAGGGQAVICAQIDPAQQVEGQVADADFFEFTVDGNQGDQIPFRIVLASPEGEVLEGFSLQLGFVGEEQVQSVAGGAYEDGYALLTNNAFIPGTFQFAVVAGDDPLPDSPIEYQIRIGEPTPCAAAQGAADYTEADESGAGHRANDIITVDFNADPPASLTEADDAAEATGLTLAPDQTVHLAGDSADVESDGDEYLDRDTFLVGTDAQVNEVDVRLTWPDGDVDMDLLTFLAETVDPELSGYRGTSVGTDEDELITIRVSPESDLWIWAGAYDDGPQDVPFGYDLTLCPRQFAP